MYEENGKSLEYIKPLENKKSKDSFKVSENNYQKIESSQTDLEEDGGVKGLTPQDKKVLASISSDNKKLTEENMIMKDEIKKLKAYEKKRKIFKNWRRSTKYKRDLFLILMMILMMYYYLLY